MSHRRPPTTADGYMTRMEETHPTLAGMTVSPFDSCSEEALKAFLQIAIEENPAEPSKPIIRNRLVCEDGRLPFSQELSLWSNWRVSRQVYRFDSTLSAELMRTPCPDDMPLDPLLHLPHRCLFVEAPCDMRGTDDDVDEYQGFFCWYDRTGKDETEGFPFVKSEECVSLVFVTSEGHRSIIQFTIESGSLGEAVERVVTKTVAQYQSNFGLTTDSEASVLMVRTMLSFACAHLLYIVADNSDQEVVYRPSGTTTRKRSSRQAASTIHAVGARVGRALGTPRVRYVGGIRHKGDGRHTVAPHVRAGHWHRYWRGPMSDPARREIVVHWISPLVVNAKKGEGLSTVIHNAK